MVAVPSCAGLGYSLRENLIKQAGKNLPVIATGEPQAIENLEEILEAAAGVMVARGDLAWSFPPNACGDSEAHHRAGAEWASR